jgi:hypothetical protein
MPVLLPRHPCRGCGGLHDLCHVGPDVFSVKERYTFTCPVTQERVNFRPYRAGQFVPACPVGAVEITRPGPGP